MGSAGVSAFPELDPDSLEMYLTEIGLTLADAENGILIDENAESLAAALGAEGMSVETFRAVGEHAMDELYLSWADSVARAAERYQSILERMARGELQPHRSRMANLFKLRDELREVRDTAHTMRETTVDTIRGTAIDLRRSAAGQLIRELNKAQEYLERYL